MVVTGVPLGIAALLVGLALAAPLAAQPLELDVAVVWVHDVRVYLAARDSAAWEPGLRLTFVERGKVVAAGELTRVYDRELALATLTSGALGRTKRLAGVRVLGERVRVRSRLPALRVAIPSARRTNPVFACADLRVVAPEGAAFEPRPEAEGASTLVRDTARASDPAWPDTIVVRPYDEEIDEEIALERGETDVAVFWPGELSARIRNDARWLTDLYGTRPRGLVAVRWDGVAPADSAARLPDARALAPLNRRLFRGDLAPWPAPASADTTGRMSPASDSAPGPRYVVDPSFPGRRAIERELEGLRPPRGEGREAPAVRLVYLDAALDPPGPLLLELHQLGAEPLFAIRCPVVGAARLRPLLTALGPDALVRLFTCESTAGKP